MASSPKPVTAPTKTMPFEEFYEKSDNANKLMDRVWYCIACSEKDVADQKICWEHWYWKEGEGQNELSSKPKAACNHTLTIDTKDKTIDYPVWPLAFTTESMKMYPAIDLKCMVIAPIGINMKTVIFPVNDSPSELRVDYCEVFGKKMYFAFALDPLISEEDKAKAFEKMEQENGVFRECFHEIQWDPKYEIGSAGEPDINPK